MTGLVGALELVPDKKNPHRPFKDVGTAGTICRDISFGNGMVMRAVRDSLIISPPLVLTHEEADILVKTAEKTLDETYQVLKRDGWIG
jgi:putrescine aminotransferase